MTVGFWSCIAALIISMSLSARASFFAWPSEVKEEFETKNGIFLNYFSQKHLVMPTLSYQRMLTEHLALLVFYGQGNLSIEKSEGGDLATDQYYRRDLNQNAKYSGAGLTYYFTENGHRTSGVFSSLQLGQAAGTVTYTTGRFGPDNGFIIIGDGKRQLEGQESKADFKVNMTQLTLGYQFSVIARGGIFGDRINFQFSGGYAQARDGEEYNLAGINDSRKFDSSEIGQTTLQFGVGFVF